MSNKYSIKENNNHKWEVIELKPHPWMSIPKKTIATFDWWDQARDVAIALNENHDRYVAQGGTQR